MLGQSWWSWSFSLDHSLDHYLSRVMSVRIDLSLVALFVSGGDVSLIYKATHLSVRSEASGIASNSESALILELASLLAGIWWSWFVSSTFFDVFLVDIFDEDFGLSVLLIVSLVSIFTRVLLKKKKQKKLVWIKNWNLLSMVKF